MASVDLWQTAAAGGQDAATREQGMLSCDGTVTSLIRLFSKGLDFVGVFVSVNACG